MREFIREYTTDTVARYPQARAQWRDGPEMCSTELWAEKDHSTPSSHTEGDIGDNSGDLMLFNAPTRFLCTSGRPLALLLSMPMQSKAERLFPSIRNRKRTISKCLSLGTSQGKHQGTAEGVLERVRKAM